MSDIYTTILIHNLFTQIIRGEELEHIIQFIIEDEERVEELLVRIDLELWWLKEKMKGLDYPINSIGRKN